MNRFENPSLADLSVKLSCPPLKEGGTGTAHFTAVPGIRGQVGDRWGQVTILPWTSCLRRRDRFSRNRAFELSPERSSCPRCVGTGQIGREDAFTFTPSWPLGILGGGEPHTGLEYPHFTGEKCFPGSVLGDFAREKWLARDMAGTALRPGIEGAA